MKVIILRESKNKIKLNIDGQNEVIATIKSDKDWVIVEDGLEKIMIPTEVFLGLFGRGTTPSK